VLRIPHHRADRRFAEPRLPDATSRGRSRGRGLGARRRRRRRADAAGRAARRRTGILRVRLSGRGVEGHRLLRARTEATRPRLVGG
jgi:hypothetical protein